MEQEQMRQWLENQGIHPRLGKNLPENSWKDECKTGRTKCSQAGFTVEKERVPQSTLHSEGRPLPCGAAAMQLRRLLYSAGEQ